MPVFVFVLVILFSFHVEAQAPPYQINWVPDNFFVLCQDGHPCPLNREQSERVAGLMSEAVDGMKKMPFRAPLDWGKRVGQGTANDYIELYQRGAGLAGAVPSCRNAGRGRSDMVVGPDVADPFFEGKEYLVYYFMAHEVFHLIQYGYDFMDQDLCKKGVRSIPGWIMEGMATAVGLEVMRKRYPSVAPSTQSEREARQFSGFRHYDEPLPHFYKDHKGSNMFTGNFPLYYTSSFWRHLANAYHQGNYGFLGAYMDRTGRKGDWMPWLRKNIEHDIGADLGMVFAGFLADYTGWGEPRYPGTFYGRKKWLDGAFGGCEKVVLDKNNAMGSVELEILPLSGKCIEVRVAALGESGLQEGESAAIQIAAFVMMGTPDSRDGLHLSMAISNDKDKFHCAKEVKRNGTKQGIGKCVLVPDDGKIRLNGGSIDGRVWTVKVQEKGEGKGELVNIYTASYTPVDVSSSDTKSGGKNPVYARFYFVLDVAELKFNGQKPPSSGADKKRSVGGFLLENSDPQTTVPKQDTSGRLANSYSLPEQFRPSIPMPAHILAGTLLNGKLSNIIVGWQLWEGDNTAADVSSVTMFPAIETGNGKYEAHPLSVGETGSFPVSIGGSMSEEVLIGTSMGTLVVDEFTDLVFRASFNGTLCRLEEWKPNKEYCPNPIPVSGKIIKAFAGTRLPGNHMVIERTPGTEMYRKAAERSLSEWSSGGSDPDSPGSGPPTTNPGTSSSAGGTLDCACTCEERANTVLRGEDIKTRREAGEDISASEVMGLMRCTSACQREYTICAMEESEQEKAAEAARPEITPDDCDCSCTVFNSLESRTAELLQGVQSGNPSAMDEMQKLGQCMSNCQDEFMSCAQR